MFWVSLRRSPVARDRLRRSLPARSMRLRAPGVGHRQRVVWVSQRVGMINTGSVCLVPQVLCHNNTPCQTGIVCIHIRICIVYIGSSYAQLTKVSLSAQVKQKLPLAN